MSGEAIICELFTTEIQSETRCWHPLGEGSETRIVADTCGFAGVKTVSIHAACELHPDEARAFAKQIEEAVAWLRERPGPGLFVKGAWIADPYTLPDEEFHRHFCCGHWGLETNIWTRQIGCRYAGKPLVGFEHSGPIPIPAWCPKRQSNPGAECPR